MKIKTNAGFSFVGTLAISLGTLTIGLGALKLNLNALNTAKIESTKVAEEALKQEVIKNLSNTEDCTENLQPANLSNPDDQTGELTVLKTITTGSFQQEGLIDIVSMTLKDPRTIDPQDPDKKLFYLYYSKPALGDRQKRIPDEDCTGGTNPKVKGCYYLSCEIEYECTGGPPCTLSKCNVNVQKCNFEGNINENNNTCTTDELRTRADINSCEDIPTTFFKDVNSKIENDGYIYGFAGFNENKAPQFVKILKVCPPGQYPVRIKKNEGQENEEVDIECKIICTGGSKLNEGTNLCYCPREKPLYINQTCQACGDDAIWNNTEQKCECNSGKVYVKHSCITCPSNARISNMGGCTCQDSQKNWDIDTNTCKLNCSPGQVRSNGRCLSCPDGTYPKPDFSGCRCSDRDRTWNATTNKCECPSITPYYYKKGISSPRCYKCPKETPNNYNERCNKCPQGQYYNSGRCNRCPPYRPHYYSGICNKCPVGQYNSHGKCCPLETHNSNGKCCPSRTHNSNGICCPYELRNVGGICCHNDRINNGICCPDDKWHSYLRRCCPYAKSNYKCCPYGTYSTNDGNECCPVGQHYYSRRCNKCPEGQHYYFSTCNRCPQNKAHYYNDRCNQCPTSIPYFHRNKCWKCPENSPIMYGGSCSRCPRSAPHYRDGKCCPSSTGACCMSGHYLNSSGRCQKDIRSCEEGWHISNNRCCENGYYYPGRGPYCCPENYNLSNGHCCPRDYYFTGGDEFGLCCPNNKVFSNGACCPRGYTFDRAHQTCGPNSQ